MTQAQEIAGQLGLVVAVDYAHSDTVPVDYVISQSIAARTQVAQGSTIKLTVSLGGQRTDYGLSDGYQQDTSFACDSYSLGLGGAWNINEKVRLNVSYFCSLYSDYNKQAAFGQETYSRTNHVIGLGLDYKF